MKKPERKIRLNVVIEESSKKYLDRLSRKQDMSLGEVVRNIIRYYADNTQ